MYFFELHREKTVTLHRLTFNCPYWAAFLGHPQISMVNFCPNLSRQEIYKGFLQTHNILV